MRADLVLVFYRMTGLAFIEDLLAAAASPVTSCAEAAEAAKSATPAMSADANFTSILHVFYVARE
jgi:hypothetical protein